MIKIRILVPVTSTAVRKAEDLENLAVPGVALSMAFISAGPPSIESRVDEIFSVPGLIAIALQAERDGIDALVIDCMGDPGLGAVREAVGIPVLGVAQTSMSMASNLAQRFAIVTVLDRIATLMNDLVALYGYERQYVGCRSISIPVLDIHHDIVKVRSLLAEASLRLVKEKDAAAIILGCTGFFGCDEAITSRLLEAGYNIPVIDPVPLTVAVAAALVNNKLSHSRISYPPFDASKPIAGFDAILQTV